MELINLIWNRPNVWLKIIIKCLKVAVLQEKNYFLKVFTLSHSVRIIKQASN